MNILPQIAQRTQRNTAELYYFAEKDSLFKIKAVLLFWGFVCVNLRDLRETLGFLLSALTCLFSRRLRRSRRGIQQAVLFRRERQVGDGCEIIAVIVVLLFVFCLRKSARSAGDLLFFFGDCLSTLTCLFSRR